MEQIILDSKKVEFKINSNNEILFSVPHNNFYRTYKFPTDKSEVEFMYLDDNISSKIIIKNIVEFVENYNLKTKDFIKNSESINLLNTDDESRIRNKYKC